jgi:hypothetical protein
MPVRRPQLPAGPTSADSARIARLAPRSGTVRMSPPLRLAVYAAGAALWASGLLWLVLHFGFSARGEFGPLPNPWEPMVMRVHGLLAVVAVFLLGWIGANHVQARWSSARNRLSGLVLGASGVLLIVSGYALYYATGALHDAAGLIHEWLGVAALAVALAHWWRRHSPR